jgi:hypothetical protein
MQISSYAAVFFAINVCNLIVVDQSYFRNSNEELVKFFRVVLVALDLCNSSTIKYSHSYFLII